MNDSASEAVQNYKELLKSYINTKDEKYLYRAEQVSKSFIRDQILPDEIVNLHNQALDEIFPQIPEEFKDSMTFLLETMIAYGLAHQEFMTLRDEQLALKSEISVAARMQETLLANTKPEANGLDIGVISVPAHQMNGDYHHLIKGKDGSLGIAVADVVGKGVPAALSMSMIKYAVDSFPETLIRPQEILSNLNRVVERNVDPSMFITMIYVHYNPETSTFTYSSAGHEPGLYYNAKKDTFTELETKGIVLGVAPEAEYKQYDLKVDEGDMLILFTDGVTECRQGDRFLEIDEVLDVIRLYKHLPAQETVNQVFKHFERLQNFQLRDDFTLVILRKDV